MNEAVNSPGQTGEIEALKKSLHNAELMVEYQRRAFDALLSISKSLGENPSVELLFSQAIEPIQDITGYTTIALRLLDERGQLVLKAYKGFSETMLEVLQRIPRAVDEPYILAMIQSKKAVVYDVPPSISPNFRNVIFVPLLGNDQIVGSMDLGSATERTWTEDEISWLELVGKYMGMIIHQIQTTGKLEALSALQEREKSADNHTPFQIHWELQSEVVEMIRRVNAARTLFQTADRILKNV